MTTLLRMPALISLITLPCVMYMYKPTNVFDMLPSVISGFLRKDGLSVRRTFSDDDQANYEY